MPDIRWRQRDVELLTREARNFNRRLNYALGKDPGAAAYLPEKIDIRALKQDITTRSEFNRAVRGLERSKRPGALERVENPHHVVATRWELQQTAIQVGIINRRRAREKAAAAPSPFKGNLMDVKSMNLDPKPWDFSKIKDRKAWAKYQESVKLQVKANFEKLRAEGYKANYLKAIEDNLGDAGAELHALISSLSPEQVYNGYFADTVMTIQFTSPHLPVELIAKTSLRVWKEYLAGIKSVKPLKE